MAVRMLASGSFFKSLSRYVVAVNRDTCLLPSRVFLEPDCLAAVLSPPPHRDAPPVTSPALPPVSSLIMLAGIFYGSHYGGRQPRFSVKSSGEAASLEPHSTVIKWQRARRPTLTASVGLFSPARCDFFCFLVRSATGDRLKFVPLIISLWCRLLPGRAAQDPSCIPSAWLCWVLHRLVGTVHFRCATLYLRIPHLATASDCHCRMACRAREIIRNLASESERSV